MWVPTKSFSIVFELWGVHQMHLVSNHLASFCVWSKTLLYWATVTRLASRSTDLQTNVIHSPRAAHYFSTRHWRGKGIIIPPLESSSCQLIQMFKILWFMAKRFSLKHGFPQPIATVKILISKTKKEHLQIKERRWIPFDVFAPPKEKRSPGEPSSGWIVIPHLISVGLVLYCGGPLFTWLSIYLRRESC